MKMDIYRNIKRVKGNKTIVENFFYISFLQLFLILAPLITYPYLTKVVGKELYGVIITAQVLVSYFSILIDFGSNSIAARYIAINQKDINNLSIILSSILSARFYLWLFGTVIYVLIVFIVPSFREYWFLFLLMYGITFNDLLFPQFFYQGMEKMKFITYVSIIVKLLFILLIFVFVKCKDDYILVPLFYSLGYLIGGIVSIAILIKKFKVTLKLQSVKDVTFYIKDCSPLLAKELISTIKDKLNIFLVGNNIGMGDVVVYDLCVKFVSMAAKPVNILGTVLLPRFAKHSTRKRQWIVLLISVLISIFIVAIANIFLDQIVTFFIHEHIDLLPVRLMLFAPIMLAVSQCLGYNYILANGMSKYILWSIVAATLIYCLSLSVILLSGKVNSLLSFVIIALLSYFTEMIYRVWVFVSCKAERIRK